MATSVMRQGCHEGPRGRRDARHPLGPSAGPLRRRRPCAALGPWPLPSRRARAEHGTVRTWWSAPAAVALLVLAACGGQSPPGAANTAPPSASTSGTAAPARTAPSPPTAGPTTGTPTRAPDHGAGHRTTTARDDHGRPHAPDHGAAGCAAGPRPDCPSDVAPSRRAHLRRRCRQPRRPLDPRHAPGRARACLVLRDGQVRPEPTPAPPARWPRSGRSATTAWATRTSRP